MLGKIQKRNLRRSKRNGRRRTEVIIRKVVGDIGIHETYMNIYDKLTNISKNVKREIHYVRSKSINSIYNNEKKEKEA